MDFLTVNSENEPILTISSDGTISVDPSRGVDETARKVLDILNGSRLAVEQRITIVCPECGKEK